MTMRYLPTLQEEDSLGIQQQVKFELPKKKLLKAILISFKFPLAWDKDQLQ
jgi:hypothetical protein